MVLGFSYITPRKNNYKQDKKTVEDFKKNLPNEIKLDEELWFYDESRFGTHSKVGHVVGLKLAPELQLK